MRAEKAEYSKCLIGPGGRYCSCCAPISKDLKRMEHRKARRLKKQHIKFECKAEDYQNV